jgi:hypothetical protein
MKQEVAETICTMIDDIFARLLKLDIYLRENSDGVPIERFSFAVCTCVLELDLKILEPVYKKYPHLKPPYLP